MSKGLKFFVDMGPLIAFFAVNYMYGLMMGTAVLMVTTMIAIAISYKLEKRVPLMPAIGCIFVMLFGGLTLVFDDEMFIKIKPTVVNILLSGALAAGLLFGRLFLKNVMSSMISITDSGWKTLTFYWIAFFLILAGINEFVWRTYDTDTWVSFKAFGIPLMAIVFSFATVPVINKHLLEDQSD